MRKRTLGRECALKILYQVDVNQDKLDEVLKDFWESWPASDDVREFAEQIVRGTIKNLSQIDSVINKYAENWEMNRMAVVDRNILRFAVFELLFMDDIPPKVTINEAVNMAKKYSQDEAGKFVNGVLDKIHHKESKKPDSSTSEEPSK